MGHARRLRSGTTLMDYGSMGTVRELDTAGVVVRELVFREGMFLSALEAVDADTP